MKAARRLNRACGMLAFSVLADSALEHYRGGFHNKAMYAPLVASSLSLAASLHGGGDPRYGAHGGRHAIYALSALTGLAGLGFHTWNIGKRPGGFSWLNLFYAAPIGAPAALILCGTLGFSAERVRDNQPGTVPRTVRPSRRPHFGADEQRRPARNGGGGGAVSTFAAPSTTRSCSCRSPSLL